MHRQGLSPDRVVGLNHKGQSVDIRSARLQPLEVTLSLDAPKCNGRMSGTSVARSRLSLNSPLICSSSLRCHARARR